MHNLLQCIAHTHYIYMNIYASFDAETGKRAQLAPS